MGDVVAEAQEIFKNALFKYELNKGTEFNSYFQTGLEMKLWRNVQEHLLDKRRSGPKPVIVSTDSVKAGENSEMTRTLGDSLEQRRERAPEEQAELNIQATDLAAALKKIDRRYREVLELRFGLTGEAPMTLKEVGKVLGLTRERIRQIESKALDKLKIHMKAHNDDTPDGPGVAEEKASFTGMVTSRRQQRTTEVE